MATHAPDPGTGDVLLRDMTEGDLPILFEQQLDPEANQMAAFPPRDRDAFLAHWTRLLSDAAIPKKTILFEGQVAGYISSFERDGQSLVGYWIGRHYWGKGIATRALATFLDHVKARPLYAHVAKHNIASIRVLEKCGFTRCGETRGDAGGWGDDVEEVILALGAPGEEAACHG